MNHIEAWNNIVQILLAGGKSDEVVISMHDHLHMILINLKIVTADGSCKGIGPIADALEKTLSTIENEAKKRHASKQLCEDSVRLLNEYITRNK